MRLDFFEHGWWWWACWAWCRITAHRWENVREWRSGAEVAGVATCARCWMTRIEGSRP